MPVTFACSSAGSLASLGPALVDCMISTTSVRVVSDAGSYRLTELLLSRGIAHHMRSYNGPGFTAVRVRRWLRELGVETLLIEAGSPWQNGCNGSFHGKPRDELLNAGIFRTPTEAQVLIERWRRHYNTVRLQSAFGYVPPAPEAEVMLNPVKYAVLPGRRINWPPGVTCSDTSVPAGAESPSSSYSASKSIKSVRFTT